MKVLTIHNIYWAHYKNALFESLQKKAKSQNIDWYFVQIARNELSRKKMESFISNEHQYNYNHSLLFNDFIENTSSIHVFFKLLKELNRVSPDVLNLTGFNSWINLSLIAIAKLKGIKVIISNDSTQTDNPAVAWKMSVKKWAVNKADGFFCFGKGAVNYMKALGAHESNILARHCAVVDNQKIERIHSKFTTQTIKKNLIYVGRISEEKNINLLIGAFAELNAPDWKLTLLGEGNLKDSLISECKALGIDDRVNWLNGVPWYEVPQHLANADILILPSKSEPWGLVVNEAMVCKMPVIISDKCGCGVDLVTNQSEGFIFNFEDKTALKKAMQFFVDNPNEIKSKGNNAYESVQMFSLDNATSEIINGIKRL